jgi:hypothetical protein
VSRRQENISSVYIGSNLSASNTANPTETKSVPLQNFLNSDNQENQESTDREKLTSEQFLQFSDTDDLHLPDASDNNEQCKKKENIAGVCSDREENALAEYFQLLGSQDAQTDESDENVASEVDLSKENSHLSMKSYQESSPDTYKELGNSPAMLNENNETDPAYEVNNLFAEDSTDLHQCNDFIVLHQQVVNDEAVSINNICAETDRIFDQPMSEFIPIEKEKYPDDSTSDEDSLLVQDHSEVWHNFVNSDNDIETVIDFATGENAHPKSGNQLNTTHCVEISDLVGLNGTVAKLNSQEYVSSESIIQDEGVRLYDIPKLVGTVFHASPDFILKSSPDPVSKIFHNDNTSQLTYQDPVSSSSLTADTQAKSEMEQENQHTAANCMSREHTNLHEKEKLKNPNSENFLIQD